MTPGRRPGRDRRGDPHPGDGPRPLPARGVRARRDRGGRRGPAVRGRGLARRPPRGSPRSSTAARPWIHRAGHIAVLRAARMAQRVRGPATTSRVATGSSTSRPTVGPVRGCCATTTGPDPGGVHPRVRDGLRVHGLPRVQRRAPPPRPRPEPRRADDAAARTPQAGSDERRRTARLRPAQHGARPDPGGVGHPPPDRLDPRDQEPTAIGAYGVSLGGYTTALLGAFDGDLAAAIAGIPVWTSRPSSARRAHGSSSTGRSSTGSWAAPPSPCTRSSRRSPSNRRSRLTDGSSSPASVTGCPTLPGPRPLEALGGAAHRLVSRQPRGVPVLLEGPGVRRRRAHGTWSSGLTRWRGGRQEWAVRPTRKR